MYDWMDHNDELEMYPVDIVNDPRIIGQNKNMISINSAVEIDLCGQVCAEKVGGKMYSGSGGQMDFIRGTRYSEGGKSIIALSSTALGGKVSRIVPRLTEGVVTSSAMMWIISSPNMEWHSSSAGRRTREPKLLSA